MSVQFNRLAYSSAALEDVQGQALPKDSKALKQWLDGLPRGNAREMAQILHTALALSVRAKMQGTERFNQLEPVRPSVIDSIAWLERQFLGSPLPLSDERLAFARIAMQLHAWLADGYRMACHEICSPNGSIPLLKGGTVSTAIARSIWHYQQNLVLGWKLYQSPAQGIWQGLHRVYQFAVSLKLEGKDIADPSLDGTVRTHDLYVETALMSLMNPFAFAQTEQDQIRSLAKGFSTRCQIDRLSTAKHAVKIPIEADLPVDADLPDDNIAYLQTEPLVNALEGSKLNSDSGQAEIEIHPELSQTVHISVLKKVRRALGMAMARDFTRIYESYPIETIVAMGGIHYFAAGKLDFENYIQKLSQMGNQGLNMAADWISMGADPNTQKSLTATVLDHSLGGYRLQWAAGQPLRIRVGEIIGLNTVNPDLEPVWMVGVVRWLRYEQDGSVLAGIKLLSRRCSAVALRVGPAGRAGSLMRGLELTPLHSHQPRSLLMSGRLEGRHQEVEVLYTFDPGRLGRTRLVEHLKTKSASLASNMDYSVLSIEA
jgi:hypothetical protein